MKTALMFMPPDRHSSMDIDHSLTTPNSSQVRTPRFERIATMF